MLRTTELPVLVPGTTVGCKDGIYNVLSVSKYSIFRNRFGYGSGRGSTTHMASAVEGGIP